MKLKFTPGLKVFNTRKRHREQLATQRQMVRPVVGVFSNAAVDLETLKNMAAEIGMNWDTLSKGRRRALENMLDGPPMTSARMREIVLRS